MKVTKEIIQELKDKGYSPEEIERIMHNVVRNLSVDNIIKVKGKKHGHHKD